MPNAKPFPLYTDGTNIYTSFDGGATFITITSGGAGTIHTSAPLSGDGSVGTPATVAAGAIALTKLATQADQTVLLNVSGGAASPIAGSKAQALTLLGLSSAVTWRQAMFAFVQSQYPTMGTETFVDFNWGTTGDYTTALAAGNGVANISQAFKGGVLEIDTGSSTTNGSRIAAQPKGPPALVGNMLTGGPWFIGCRAETVTGIDATGAGTVIGLADVSFSNTVGIKMIGSVSTTNYQFVVSGSTTIDLGIAIDTSHFKDFGVGFDGVTLVPYFGDVLAGTFAAVAGKSSTDLTGLPANPGFIFSLVLAGSGAVRTRIELDKQYGATPNP